MINNNTQQPQVVSTGQTTESNIYLKKSELPKNISTFRNDAGYISESSLESWLKSHSYLSKNEINNLIKQANLVVVDSINSTIDSDAIQRLNDAISGQSREIKEIKNRLLTIESGQIDIRDNKINIEKINSEIGNIKSAISNLESIEIPESVNLDGYATEDWVKRQKFLKSQDLREYVKTSEIESFIPPYPDLSGFANVKDIPTKLSELTNDIEYITSSSLKSYAKKTDIPSVPDVSRFITREDVPAVPTKVSELTNDKGYITSSSLKGYARLTDIPSIPDVSKFITTDDVPTKLSELANDKGYVTNKDVDTYIKNKIPTIDTGFVKSDYVDGRISLVNSRIDSVRGEIPSLDGYATQQWVEDKHYLTSHQSLSAYAKKKDLGDYVSILQLESTLGDYAKTNSVYSKNYIDVELSKFLPKTDAEKIYVNKTDANKTYLSKKEALGSYLRIEDYRGIKDATTINSEYKEKTIDDLMEDIDSIRNGFYIVHHNDIVVVKDHEVLQMFKDGVPSTIIEWKEE